MKFRKLLLLGLIAGWISAVFGVGPEAEVFVIADATGDGDNAVRKTLFAMYLEDPSTPFKLQRVTQAEAGAMLEDGRAKLALMEFRGEKIPFSNPCYPYAAGALVFYVNAENFTRHLNREQAVALLTDNVPGWSKYTGNSAAIQRIRLKASSPGGTLPERMLLDFGQKADKGFFKVGTVGELVLLVQANVLSLGAGVYCPELPVTVRKLAFAGVEPTGETVRNGKYPLAFRRAAVWKKSGAQPPVLRKLLNQLQTAEFADRLAEDALIPASR